MAPGEPNSQVGYGPEGKASNWVDELPGQEMGGGQIAAAK